MTSSYVWTGLNSYVKQDSATPGRVNVNTGNLNAEGTHTVSVQNTITIASNGDHGSETFNPTDSNDKVEFTFTISNPCKTTTLNTITVSGADSTGPYSKSM